MIVMSTSERENPAIKLMSERRSRLMTKEGMQKALSFIPRSSDVIVATPMKCGTTWIQQIMHQLRSGGDRPLQILTKLFHGLIWLMMSDKTSMPNTNISLDVSRRTLGMKSVLKAENILLSIGSLVHHSTVHSVSSKEDIFNQEK